MVSRVLMAGIAIAVALMAVGLVLGVSTRRACPRTSCRSADLPALLGTLDPGGLSLTRASSC